LKLDGKHVFQASRESVWNALNDTETLKKCTPGCKQLIQLNEEEYEAKLEIGVAAIKGEYDGKIVLSDKTLYEAMTLQISASGTAGVVSATAHLRFKEDNGQTVVEYEGEGRVSGLIAGVGQRMLAGVAKFMLNQFFKAVAKEVNR
jgi:carbon monoxide dehydrogenase subunit G